MINLRWRFSMFSKKEIEEKQCFKCGNTKQLSEFYKHKGMADGHLNKCIDCAKKDARKHRSKNINSIRRYDRKRGKEKHRIYKNIIRNREYREKNPEKYKAHCCVNNAMRDKRLFKKPCVVCKTTKRLEAHHEDYSKPLDVTWLCSIHHSQLHHCKRIEF
jgi:hypothetical protein